MTRRHPPMSPRNRSRRGRARVRPWCPAQLDAAVVGLDRRVSDRHAGMLSDILDQCRIDAAAPASVMPRRSAGSRRRGPSASLTSTGSPTGIRCMSSACAIAALPVCSPTMISARFGILSTREEVFADKLFGSFFPIMANPGNRRWWIRRSRPRESPPRTSESSALIKILEYCFDGGKSQKHQVVVTLSLARNAILDFGCSVGSIRRFGFIYFSAANSQRSAAFLRVVFRRFSDNTTSIPPPALVTGELQPARVAARRDRPADVSGTPRRQRQRARPPPSLSFLKAITRLDCSGTSGSSLCR